MTTSFVLRVVPAPAGDLAGEVEVVLSGERTVVRSGDQLLAYLRAALRGDGSDVERFGEWGVGDPV